MGFAEKQMLPSGKVWLNASKCKKTSVKMPHLIITSYGPQKALDSMHKIYIGSFSLVLTNMYLKMCVLVTCYILQSMVRPSCAGSLSERNWVTLWNRNSFMLFQMAKRILKNKVASCKRRLKNHIFQEVFKFFKKLKRRGDMFWVHFSTFNFSSVSFIFLERSWAASKAA